MLAPIEVGCCTLEEVDPRRISGPPARLAIVDAGECEGCGDDIYINGVNRHDAVQAAAWLLRFADHPELANLVEQAEDGRRAERAQQSREQAVAR